MATKKKPAPKSTKKAPPASALPAPELGEVFNPIPPPRKPVDAPAPTSAVAAPHGLCQAAEIENPLGICGNPLEASDSGVLPRCPAHS